MKWFALFMIAVSPAAFAATALPAEEAQRLLDEATAAFNQANEAAQTDKAEARRLYESAILRYERLVEVGGIHNGKLYYNLANAYFLNGDLGQAILNYRRAEAYLPDDANVQQNLAFARSQQKDALEASTPNTFTRALTLWHDAVPVDVRMPLFFLLWFILWVAATMRLFKKRSGLTITAAFAAIAAVILYASIDWQVAQARAERPAVVVADEVTARKGNSETYQPAFDAPLHAGAECVILEQRGHWSRVLLVNGVECWLPANAVEPV